MPNTEANDIAWNLLDHCAVNDLVAQDGADRVLGALMGSALSPEAQAQTLSDLAVEGNVPALKKNTVTFKSWSDEHGLRRLSNILIELERVLELPARGQAILQAQALTRFIILHLDTDIAAFKRAVSSSD
jgi:hypothetical protein